MKPLSEFVLREYGRRIRRFRGNTEKHGVIGHCIEVERIFELKVKTSGVLDGLSLCKAIGIMRRRKGPHHVGVERVGGVHMKITKESAPLWVGLGHRLLNDDLVLNREHRGKLGVPRCGPLIQVVLVPTPECDQEKGH